MRTVTIACAIAVIWPTAAVAHVHRFYVSALGGIDAGARGPISSGSLPTIGGTAGLRLSEGWSLEEPREPRTFRTLEPFGGPSEQIPMPSIAIRGDMERPERQQSRPADCRLQVRNLLEARAKIFACGHVEPCVAREQHRLGLD